MSRKRRPTRISLQPLFSAAALALAILLLVVMAQRITTNIVLWRQTQQLQAEIDAARRESERLEKRKLYVQTDEYIELVARRDMKLARPGETAVIGVPAQPTAAPAAPREWWEPISGH